VAALVGVLITASIVVIGLLYAFAVGKLVLARALVVVGALAAPACASALSSFTTTMAVLVAVASAAAAALAIRLRRVPWEALPLTVAGLALLAVTPITA
jgi:hypothetical protein